MAKALRIRKGYSQVEIAIAYGYAQAYISMLESGALRDADVRSYLDFLAILTPKDDRAGGSVRVRRKREASMTTDNVDFEVLEDRKEVASVRKALRRLVAAGSSKPRTMTLGHQGNTWEGSMYYIPALDMWTVFDDGENESELWNTYGIGNPLNGGSRDMVCHLSVPIEGINRRIGAVYARSRKDGKTYILHRGKIGGGREGVGKSAFFAHYKGKIATATDGDRTTDFAVVGCIDAPNFLRGVRKFVSDVKDIKEKATA